MKKKTKEQIVAAIITITTGVLGVVASDLVKKDPAPAPQITVIVIKK